MNWVEYLKRFVGRSGATQLATGKSLVDAVGHDGTTAKDTGLDAKITILDTVADSIKAITDAIPDSGALTAIETNIIDIETDTNELQTDLADGGRVDLLIDTIDTVVDAVKARTDNLIGAQSDSDAGAFSFDETSALNQSMLIILNANMKRRKFWGMFIDGANITQSTTAKLFVDLGAGAVTQMELEDYQTTIAAGKAVDLLRANSPFAIDTDVEIKLACGGGGAGNVDVYYRVIYEEME